MKTIKNVFIVIIVSLFVFLLVSCEKENNIPILNIPNNLSISEDEVLSWDSVKNATGYKVIIKNYKSGEETFDTKSNSIDLFSYFRNRYIYQIVVYAYDETGKYLESDNSEEIRYQNNANFNYFKIRLINNGTAYEIAAADNDAISGKLILPDMYNDIPITKIAEQGFSNCVNIKYLIIPDTITEIGQYAFYMCTGLEKVELPDSITELKDSVFAYCSNLVDINIPNTIKRLYCSFFMGCSSLESIHIPYSVEEIRPSFNGCDSLKNITIDEDNDVYKAENSCIIKKEDNSLVVGTNYSVIPEHVTSIGHDAFVGCRLITEFTIPGQVKNVGESAFSLCDNLKTLIIEEGVEYLNGSLSGVSSIERIVVPSTLKTFGGNPFCQFSNFKSFETPNGNDYYKVEGNCIIEINESRVLCAFKNNVQIPSYIKTIGRFSFAQYECDSIVLPDGIELIEEGAFLETNLREIILPSSLKEIGEFAFASSEISNIVFNDKLEKIDGCAFTCCANLKNVIIPKSVKFIGPDAFSYCYCSIILYDNVETIWNYAFFQDSVYTTMDYLDFEEGEKFKNYGDAWAGGTNGLLLFNCDIEDDYVTGFQYFRVDLSTDDYVSKPRTSCHMFAPKSIPSIVPYREGYIFKGWTLNKDTNEIVIEPYNVTRDETYDYPLPDSIEKTTTISNDWWITEGMVKNWENEQIFYAVWEKVE